MNASNIYRMFKFSTFAHELGNRGLLCGEETSGLYASLLVANLLMIMIRDKALHMIDDTRGDC